MDFKFTITVLYYLRILENTEIVSLEQTNNLIQKWVYPDSIINKHGNSSLWLQKVAKWPNQGFYTLRQVDNVRSDYDIVIPSIRHGKSFLWEARIQHNWWFGVVTPFELLQNYASLGCRVSCNILLYQIEGFFAYVSHSKVHLLASRFKKFFQVNAT